MFWKKLNSKGKAFFGIITFLVVTSYFTIPAGRLALYLISNDDIINVSSKFTSCDYNTPSITWDEDNTMQVNKKLHFCGSPEQRIPTKTKLTLPDGTIILPTEESDAFSTFNVDFMQLPVDGWHIVKF